MTAKPNILVLCGRNKRRSRWFSITVLTLLLSACNSMNRAHFWEDFEKDKHVSVYSNHGPWGGVSKVSWRSEQEGTFITQDIIDFAKENGWEFSDSLHYPDSSLHLNLSEEGAYFDHLLAESLAGLDSGSHVVLLFKTGMIAIRPGNTDDTERNGFVVINEKGSGLNLFYRWGE